MHIKWLSQCQRAFAAVPAAGRRTFQALRETDNYFLNGGNHVLSLIDTQYICALPLKHTAFLLNMTQEILVRV